MEGRGRGLESATGNPKTQTPPAAYLRLGYVVLHIAAEWERSQPSLPLQLRQTI